MRLLLQGRQLLLLTHFTKQKLLPLVHSCSRTITSWKYEDEKKNFNLHAPPYYNFARDVVDKWADKERIGERDNNPALWWIDDSGNEIKWSFRDVSHQSKLCANVLMNACKLETNDLVIVMLPRVPQWWAINIAAIRAGIILSPGTTLLTPSDIKYRINASNAKCIITNAECADNVDEVSDLCPSLQTKLLVGEGQSRSHSGTLSYKVSLFWWRRPPTFPGQKPALNSPTSCINSKSDDPMTVFFTSGTTGAPKMTEHTHSSYGLGHIITAKYFLDLSPSDILWNLSDTGWAKCAWSSLFAPWIAGACVFAQDSPRFDPQQTLQTLTRYPISHFCAAPTAVRFLVATDLKQYRYTSLRRCLSAGEPVNPEMLEEWEEGTGLKLYEGYGQTETTFLCGTYSSIEQRPGSMGKPAPGYEIQVVDEVGQVLPRGKEGNIGILCKPHKPVGLFSRYIDDDERMKSVFVGDYYLTGDRAIMDEDDYVWFVGRADDVIITSGYRIGPFEVESALIEHPAVLESAVVSSPDYSRGEVVKAFVTLTEAFRNVDKDKLAVDLQQHTKMVTAPYKYPRKIEFVDSLPKTVSGKIRRVELRNKEWGRDSE